VDPEAGIRANAVRTFFERGLIDQARAQAALAVSIAEKLGQPLALSLAHWRAGMLAVRLGDVARVAAHAERMGQVVATTCVIQGDGPSCYLRGWALARQGRPQEGIELIRDGLERHLRLGMIASSTEVMGYAVEALLLAGDVPGANRELAAAFARSRELDEHYYLPVLLVLQARAADAQGDAAGAGRWLRQAVDVARGQEAPGFELKAALALAAHSTATSGDREALRRVLESLPEGRDTQDAVRAGQLLSAM
jgi:tetratricopeptide (TPR) repeat protein